MLFPFLFPTFMSFPLPRPVRKGSRLAVIAPAGPFNEESFKKGIDWLSERYEISHRPDICSKAGYFAGDDTRRLTELNEAILDPDIDAIICARGGFGATRLLPGIDLQNIRSANKMIVGFSDITALHALWTAAGVRSVHAPMVAALGNAPEIIREKWISALEHPAQPLHWCLQSINDAATKPVSGILTGGNLAVLGALIGTPYCPPLDGHILFLEDVGERPYRVDRLLTTMSQAGWFNRIAGLLIGAFTEGEPGTDGVTIDEVLARHFAGAPFPVLSGLTAGHIDDNEALPFGAEVRIEDGLASVSGETGDLEKFA
jgi:muramoyltetrapeptide carboxypeptidase